jgi:hypothetical protein
MWCHIIARRTARRGDAKERGTWQRKAGLKLAQRESGCRFAQGDVRGESLNDDSRAPTARERAGAPAG